MGIHKCRLPEYNQISQREVLELAKKYNNIKKIEFLCKDTVKIVTVLDTFFCEIGDKFLVLKHQVNPRKQHCHFQRVFWDFKFLFESLGRHDTYKYTRRGTCKLEHLYNLIKCK